MSRRKGQRSRAPLGRGYALTDHVSTPIGAQLKTLSDKDKHAINDGVFHLLSEIGFEQLPKFLECFVDNKIITDSHIKSYENEILSRKTETKTDEKPILDLNLKNEFTQVISLPNEESYENQLYNDINIFIDEQKRVFDGEIHFFDHPYFGIVISIEKI